MYGVHANGSGCPAEARNTGSLKAGVTDGCAGIEPRSYAGAMRALLTQICFLHVMLGTSG